MLSTWLENEVTTSWRSLAIWMSSMDSGNAHIAYAGSKVITLWVLRILMPVFHRSISL
jgi:hypothetical protein